MCPRTGQQEQRHRLYGVIRGQEEVRRNIKRDEAIATIAQLQAPEALRRRRQKEGSQPVGRHDTMATNDGPRPSVAPKVLGHEVAGH